jgi:predicted GNAT superfamily acetyltransferase
MTVNIRRLRTHAEYLSAEDIQRTVWHFPEREVIPLNELVVAQRIGGHVLGAFDRGRLIAFSFGIPGYVRGKVFHYSRMTGVLPPYQNSGVGYRLKLAQRAYVLAQGLDLVRWTFDPLQSRNARFNIEKLGCVIDEYLVNVYGASGSRFNAGLETDRFVPKWWIQSKRVADRLAGRTKSIPIEAAFAAFPPLIEATVRKNIPRPGRIRAVPRGRRASVEIPSDIDRVKQSDIALARAWRRSTREAFRSLLARGFAVTGFSVGNGRSLYLLERP